MGDSTRWGAWYHVRAKGTCDAGTCEVIGVFGGGVARRNQGMARKKTGGRGKGRGKERALGHMQLLRASEGVLCCGLVRVSCAVLRKAGRVGDKARLPFESV